MSETAPTNSVIPIRGGYTGKPEETLRKLALQKMLEYRVDALDAIYDLATMPITENSAQNQVKLAAAKLLAAIEDAPKTVENGGINSMLDTLNDAYHKAAPRIRSVRERVVTFETEPRTIEQTAD